MIHLLTFAAVAMANTWIVSAGIMVTAPASELRHSAMPKMVERSILAARNAKEMHTNASGTRIIQASGNTGK